MRTIYKEMLKGIIPAIVFWVVYKYVSFIWAVITGFGVGVVVYSVQYYKNKKLTTFGYLGVFGLIIQTIISLLAKNPNTYFIYPMISNAIYALVFGFSLMLKNDAVSFFARDFCEDEEIYIKIKPAFRKLTVIWTVFFILKTILKLVGITNWSFELLYTVNWFLGTPVYILLLLYSLEYPNRYIKTISMDNQLKTDN